MKKKKKWIKPKVKEEEIVHRAYMESCAKVGCPVVAGGTCIPEFESET